VQADIEQEAFVNVIDTDRLRIVRSYLNRTQTINGIRTVRTYMKLCDRRINETDAEFAWHSFIVWNRLENHDRTRHHVFPCVYLLKLFECCYAQVRRLPVDRDSHEKQYRCPMY
jgi:hypothetical protein